MLLMVEDAGTRNVVRRPIITGPKSKAAVRSLVMPMNVTSILPSLNASIMSAGLWMGISSCGTPRRRANSMPRSGLQPLSCPLCSTAKYDSISTPTRSLPLGANCLAVSAACCARAASGHAAAPPMTVQLGVGQIFAQHLILIHRQIVAVARIDLHQADAAARQLELGEALHHHLGVLAVAAVAHVLDGHRHLPAHRLRMRSEGRRGGKGW